MKSYNVSWEIEIFADNPEDAAREALAIQRDPNCCATVFAVTDERGDITHVDLTEIEEASS